MGFANAKSEIRPIGYWRRLGQAVLSALVPGAGQLLGGATTRGFVLLGAAVLVAAGAAGGVAAAGIDTTLAWVIGSSALLVLVAVDVLLLAFRVFAVVDAFRVPRASNAPWPPEVVGSRAALRAAQRGRRVPVVAVIFLALLLLLTAAPHIAAGYYLYVSHDLVVSVFTDRDSSEGSSSASTSLAATSLTGVTTTSLTASTTVTNSRPAGTSSTSFPTSITPPSSSSVLTSGNPSGTVPTGEEPLADPDDDGRLTVLLIGTDAGYGRSGARADSIMVATADLNTGRLALFGIARNTGSVPLGEAAAKALGTKIYLNLISSLYFDASQHPELAPPGQDPGAAVLRETISMLLGIPIDYYAVVDMGGFVKVVDAMGGVTLNVKERVQVRLSPPTPEEKWRVYDIEPGIRHLSGLEALAFARSRTGSSDYVRMGRQRCIIAALLYQNGAAEFLLKFPTLAQVIKESVRTDIPLNTLQALIRARSRIKADETITVGFTRPKYTKGVNAMGYNILDVDLVQQTVRKIIEHPEEIAAEASGEQALDNYDCWKVK